MTEDALGRLLLNLLHQGPILLAYLAGVLLSLHYWRRAPHPCLCVLLGCGLMLVVGLVSITLLHYLPAIGQRRNWRWHEQIEAAETLRQIGIFGRALGMALLAGAALVGRNPRRAAPRPDAVTAQETATTEEREHPAS